MSTPQPGVGDLLGSTGALRERAERMQAELAAVLETVSSPDGLATVTVGAGGIMRDVHITGSSSATPARIRHAILTAYQRGCRSVGEQAAEITQRYAPGSPAVAMMRAAVPPDPDDEDEQPGNAR